MRKLKITCDCCKEEIEGDKVYTLEHYIHVAPDFDRMKGHARLIDGAMHAISGRKESKDFCLPCYNRLFDGFFNAIAEFQKQNFIATL